MQLPAPLKDPLAHFLIVGAILFIVLSAVKPPENEDSIVVDRTALLSFVQYRSKAFEPHAAAALLDAMSEDERKRIIDDYIREEALYREARQLGLDEGDYVIRRRMVQKLEFMSEAATPPQQPDMTDLQAWYEANIEDYALQPGVTFAHVYISTRNKSLIVAESDAQTLLQTLRNKDAQFEDATAYGERFLFHTNYVERTFDYVKSHFGAEAAEFIFSNETPLSTWTGPVTSEHGVHLIYVTNRNPGRIPPLDEIRSRIAADLIRERQRDEVNQLINAIIDNYSPVINIKIPPAVSTSEKSE